MGTTIVKKELVAREKVPSLTKLSHVASLKVIDRIAKIKPSPGLYYFKIYIKKTILTSMSVCPSLCLFRLLLREPKK